MKKITDVLFFCFLLNIVPAALLGVFDISESTYTFLFAIVFCVQTALMVLCGIKNKIRITKKETCLLFFIFFIQLLSSLISILIFNRFFYSEIIVIVSVFTNIMLFIIFAAKYKNCSNEDIDVLFKRIIIIGVISCIINFLLNYRGILSLGFIHNSYEAQFSSFFKNRNTYGIFMLICIISNQYLTRRNKNRYGNVIGVLFLTNLLLTMSRTSLIGLIVFFLRLIIETHSMDNISKKRIGAIFLGVVVISFSIIALSTNETLYNRLDSLFFRTHSIESGSGRFDVWKNGVNIAINYNPLLGVGRYNALWLNENVYNNNLPYFHSIYIEMLATYGFLGLALLIYAMIRIHMLINDSENITKQFLKSLFLAFVIISIFETTTRFSIGYADTISMIFFFTVPILISTANKKQPT